MILVVPVDPEFLPETLLLIAATFALVAAIRFLIAGRRGAALKSAAGGLACIVVVLVLVKTTHPEASTPALVPEKKSGGADSSGSMTLVLGGVSLGVTPSEHYVLSADGTPFLKLGLHRSELRVTCTVESEGGIAAKVADNTIPVRTGALDVRRDAHTLLVQSGGNRALWVHYADAGRIEIEGDFYERKRDEDAQLSAHLITFRNGIEWPGGRIAKGTVMHLYSKGEGRIDFGPEGAVRIVTGD